MINKLIEKIREYGINNDVQIMCVQYNNTIKKIILDNNIHSILEIGTAIGYSTICFANTDGINKITSI